MFEKKITKNEEIRFEEHSTFMLCVSFGVTRETSRSVQRLYGKRVSLAGKREAAQADIFASGSTLTSPTTHTSKFEELPWP